MIENQFLTTQQALIDNWTLPATCGAELWTRNYGDAMEPKIGTGALLGIKPQKNLDFILYGQSYLIVTNSYTLVRNIYPFGDGGDDLIILRATNPNRVNCDIVIGIDEIEALYIVTSVITRYS